MIDEVEKQCRSILKKYRVAKPRWQPVLNVIREMGILLEQLTRSRITRRDFLKEIEAFRSKARNRQLRIRRDHYEPPELRIERNDSIQRYTSTMINLETQRRGIISTFDSEQRTLELQLAKLLNQYEILTLHNGD